MNCNNERKMLILENWSTKKISDLEEATETIKPSINWGMSQNHACMKLSRSRFKPDGKDIPFLGWTIAQHCQILVEFVLVDVSFVMKFPSVFNVSLWQSILLWVDRSGFWMAVDRPSHRSVNILSMINRLECPHESLHALEILFSPWSHSNS